jgi:hypothetical protein
LTSDERRQFAAAVQPLRDDATRTYGQAMLDMAAAR